ncbi:TetR/AcrR family transcriptional regulator [Nocardia barduliensis]|uniref:TetR/AcrR family transcriptional regulator n=1 Tax=Nocardia barduliensis TaxID=2736643 RepID=UPI0015730F85|nr:TetR/AcrR family transcriptional regulator [Nocardia barduliensis]
MSSIRDRVLLAALECFSDEGYERTTIARIRERSGVSNGALFHHFRSKEAIAGALYVDSMRSVHEGYREVLAVRPATLAEGVGGVIRGQLSWVEANPARARFVYAQGRLDWASEPGERLRAMNEEIGAAWREWLAPFVRRGEARELSMALVAAVVTGPAHALAQQWLAGQLPGSLQAYADDLTAAAVAGLSGSPASRIENAPYPVVGRIRVELLDAVGSVVGVAEVDAPLDGPRG